MWDVDGAKYIDCLSAYSSVNQVCEGVWVFGYEINRLDVSHVLLV